MFGIKDAKLPSLKAHRNMTFVIVSKIETFKTKEN